MKLRRPFRSVEPTFFAGLLDDPVLLLNVRPEGRSILVDCGRIHHLAKRHIKAIGTVFVTHAHMDHFMGFDTLLRSLHVSPRILELFGPPQMAERVGHKLASYDWNLSEPWWCSIRVTEVYPDRLERSIFSGPEGFARKEEVSTPREGSIILKRDAITVEGDLCDHRIPSLILRFTEKAPFLIDEERMEREGVAKGPWLREFKRLVCSGDADGRSIAILRRRGESAVEETVADAGKLFEAIRSDRPPASLGYISDVGFSEENLARIAKLMKGVSLLVCECSHLAGEKEKARLSHHLCTLDVNRIVDELRPPLFLPMHLSKTYLGRTRHLYEELGMPDGVELLRLPDYQTPRPVMACELAEAPL